MKQSKRMLHERMSDVGAIIYALGVAAVVISPLVAHIWRTVAVDWASMLIIGLVLPPVGWVHGVGIMLGWW